MIPLHGGLPSEVCEFQPGATAVHGERPMPTPQVSPMTGEPSRCRIPSSLGLGAQEPPAPPAKGAYLVTLEVIGGGDKGIVQKAWHPDTGREVAVKRLQRDNACPIRFVEFWAEGFDSFHAEGHAAVRSTSIPWASTLVFDSANEHGNLPFEAGSLDGAVVLVRRSSVSFENKLANALKGGAVGVIFINGAEKSEVYVAGRGQPLLPSVMISASEGEAAISAVRCGGARVEVRTDAEHEMAICKCLPPHPNVIRVLDAWRNDSTSAPVIVMELCTGGPLRGPCPDSATALRLVAQMLDGLMHLHAHGLCHRDLKPENVILTKPLSEPSSRVVLVDFSMASRAKRMSVPCGSQGYTAPEVTSGSYGCERDVWSAGIIAHELLFGRHPFGLMCDEQLKLRIANPEPMPIGVHACAGIDIVSEAARDLLRLLLQKDPRERISAANALAHPALAVARSYACEDVSVPSTPSSEQHLSLESRSRD